MSADWFDRYVYQAVINKKYLTKEQLEEAAGEPVHPESVGSDGNTGTVT